MHPVLEGSFLHSHRAPVHTSQTTALTFGHRPYRLACTWGNIRVTLGLYEDSGKENGNYYNGYIGYRIWGKSLGS